MIYVRGGAAAVKVSVYRDGEKVVLVGGATDVRTIGSGVGTVKTKGGFISEFSSIEAYEYAKKVAYSKNRLLYIQTVGILGVDDDATHAPDLPDDIRAQLHDDRREVHALPSAGEVMPASASSAGTTSKQPSPTTSRRLSPPPRELPLPATPRSSS
jgi:hypothetical protein